MATVTMMGFRTAVSLAVGAALWVSQPAAAGDDTAQADIKKLADLMLGDFATDPENTEETIIDRRVRVNVEGEPGIWFYSQLNTGDGQTLYRQRIHRLTLAENGKGIVQHSFVPARPEEFVDLWTRSGPIFPLGIDDMKPALGEGCEQVWTSDSHGVWRGRVDPETCSVFSERRQATIRIGAEGLYEGDTYGTTERGFDAEMNPIWGSAPGDFITLTRCRSAACSAEARRLSERNP